MICISLWQPWASALFAPRPDGSPLAIKPDETRHWPLPDRLIGKEIGLHAAKRDTREEREFWADMVNGDEMFEKAFAAIGIKSYADLPRGCLIGTVVFGSPVRTHLAKPDELAKCWGNHGPDRWSWPVVSRKLYDAPVPCLGRQGFFHDRIEEDEADTLPQGSFATWP